MHTLLGVPSVTAWRWAGTTCLLDSVYSVALRRLVLCVQCEIPCRGRYASRGISALYQKNAFEKYLILLCLGSVRRERAKKEGTKSHQLGMKFGPHLKKGKGVMYNQHHHKSLPVSLYIESHYYTKVLEMESWLGYASRKLSRLCHRAQLRT